MKKIYFLMCLFASISITAQQNITFSVDMTGQTFTQAYVSGSFNTWSGTSNPLTDMGSGIWEVTLPLADGEYEYKFTYDDWTGQDAFAQGDVCTITNYTNHNRRLVVAGAAQTLATAPFGGCAESASNPGPHNLTVNVDMNAYGGSLAPGVTINGENYNAQGFGAWCGDCTPLTDMGGGIWSITLPLEEYAYQFKITIGAWVDQEGFTPGDPGTSTDGVNTNRYIQVDADKTLNLVWNTPQILNNKDFKAANFNVYPNPARDAWNIKSNNQIIKSVQVFDVLGKQVMSVKPNNTDVELNASTLPKGLYFAKMTTDVGSNSIKLIKQ